MEFIKVGVGTYQNIPYFIDPVAIRVGSFDINWYPLMYLVAFLASYLLLRYRIRKKETEYSLGLVEMFAAYFFAGLFIGARLGYVLFYNFSYYWNNPLAIISPLDPAGNLVGIFGLSYHGGLVGIILAGWIFCRKYKMDFWPWAEFLIPAIPAGYFFGRIGNFLNGELYGRNTEKFWGMYFPTGGNILRHPSQLYEAFFEGLLLFVILWSIRNGIKFKNNIFPVPCFMLYVFLYGFFRFFGEFFREPDPQLGFLWIGLTLGQLFSLGMMVISVFIMLYQKRKGLYNRTETNQ